MDFLQSLQDDKLKEDAKLAELDKRQRLELERERALKQMHDTVASLPTLSVSDVKSGCVRARPWRPSPSLRVSDEITVGPL
jgi:hypothetical protein